MKITSIKQQQKNQDRASIFVDGKYTFSLSLGELVAEKLKIHQEVSEADLKRLKKLSDDGKLRARTLEWVLNRPRSVRELKDYLYRKKAEPEQIEKITTELLARNYLDEQRFAKWLIDLRHRAGKSDRAIKNELYKKGLDRELISESLKSEEGSEVERLNKLVAKKRNLTRYKNDPQKLTQFLLRQGFSYEDVKRVLS